MAAMLYLIVSGHHWSASKIVSTWWCRSHRHGARGCHWAHSRKVGSPRGGQSSLPSPQTSFRSPSWNLTFAPQSYFQIILLPGDESYPGELVQNINTLELLANGAALKQVELGLEGLPGEGGELDQVLVQKNHPLHHLSESLSLLLGTSLLQTESEFPSPFLMFRLELM